GFSGTNAHVIVEQAPAGPDVAAGAAEGAFAICAENRRTLRALAGPWAEGLSRKGELPLGGVLAAVLSGWSRLAPQLVPLAGSAAELAATLRVFAETGAAPSEGGPAPEATPGPWRRFSMPLYPFQRRRHWLDAAAVEPARARGDIRSWLASELAAIIGESET